MATESLCPFGDGAHKILVSQWGRSCVRCHKTWQWLDGVLRPTYREGV
jgi:hypothetical protein